MVPHLEGRSANLICCSEVDDFLAVGQEDGVKVVEGSRSGKRSYSDPVEGIGDEEVIDVTPTTPRRAKRKAGTRRNGAGGIRPNVPVFKIGWTDYAAGYDDLFPCELFKHEVKASTHTERIRGPRGAPHLARFLLTVAGQEATLDYKDDEVRGFNERHEIEPGRLRLTFTNERRTVIERVWWNNRPMDSEAVFSRTSVPFEQVVDQSATTVQKRLALIRVRPGQDGFRARLLLVYGRCCVSGCDVELALEGAHISPFHKEPSNSASNGLLLRSDLHVLFDGNEMGIEPKSRVVYFSPVARTWPEYEALHSLKKMWSPEAGHSQPSPARLKARWTAFVKKHGPQQSK